MESNHAVYGRLLRGILEEGVAPTRVGLPAGMGRPRRLPARGWRECRQGGAGRVAPPPGHGARRL